MNKDTVVVSTIIVAKLLTRLPMKRGERPTVSAYIGVMNRCNKVHSYLYKQSIYTKCVSEIFEHRLTIIKEYSVAKLGCGFIIAKSLDKYEQRCL